MTDTAPVFITDISDDDDKKSSYSAAVVGLAVANTPTDVFTITGSASKKIRITRIEFSGSQTTSSVRDILLVKRSTANSGGTSTTQTAVVHDSGDGAATATVRAYTVNPASLGNLVGTIRANKYDIIAANLSSSSLVILAWDFGTRPAECPVLNGTGEVLAINLNSVTTSGNSLDIYVEWTEE